MTETVENAETVEETKVEETPKVDPFDPREWARKTASAYRYETMVENTHLPEINRPQVIPVKETFECNSRYINNPNGTYDVVADHDLEGGALIEECHYWVLESRLNDFIKGTKDKIAIRVLWTLPCGENIYRCEEDGPHIILPKGNAMAYRAVDNPNAYYTIDDVTRTIRFYALRPIAEGEAITIKTAGAESLGRSGVTATEFREISGMNMAIPGTGGGGCSSCQQKKQFRERTVEGQ